MIEEQKSSITKLQESIELNAKKGELMYEKYGSLNKMQEAVKELRKTKGWEEVAKELRKEKKIIKVDLVHKTVTIDL